MKRGQQLAHAGHQGDLRQLAGGGPTLAGVATADGVHVLLNLPLLPARGRVTELGLELIRLVRAWGGITVTDFVACASGWALQGQLGAAPAGQVWQPL